MAGLFIVATPIGNLGDVSSRAREVLAGADLVLAEDTRTSQKLFAHLGIAPKRIASYHDYNKERVSGRIIEDLKAGKTVALISDAGTPGIADPAFNLVRSAIDLGIPVLPVPGACALIAALACSGLPTDRFVFENFLPVKSGRRRALLEELAHETRTVIFYESPHRIVKVLKEMAEVLGDVKVVIARELTKMFEEFLRGSPDQILQHFSKTDPRGEMTVLFNPRIRAASPVPGRNSPTPSDT
jgi:16S rRNA (cytidine1402-2'-O)-methyltransferase